MQDDICFVEIKILFFYVLELINLRNNSLKPVKAYENIDQVLAVARLIEHVGKQDWNFDMPILDQLEFLDNPNLDIEKETPLYIW